jgi:hypothetical protein
MERAAILALLLPVLGACSYDVDPYRAGVDGALGDLPDATQPDAFSDEETPEPVEGGPIESGLPDADHDGDPEDTTPAPDDAPPDGDGTCRGTFEQCLACCDTKVPTGGPPFRAALTACACRNNSCGKDECKATFCKQPGPLAPDGRCGTCLRSSMTATGDCKNVDCKADANCVAYEACIRGCS